MTQSTQSFGRSRIHNQTSNSSASSHMNISTAAPSQAVKPAVASQPVKPAVASQAVKPAVASQAVKSAVASQTAKPVVAVQSQPVNRAVASGSARVNNEVGKNVKHKLPDANEKTRSAATKKTIMSGGKANSTAQMQQTLQDNKQTPSTTSPLNRKKAQVLQEAGIYRDNGQQRRPPTQRQQQANSQPTAGIGNKKNESVNKNSKKNGKINRSNKSNSGDDIRSIEVKVATLNMQNTNQSLNIEGEHFSKEKCSNSKSKDTFVISVSEEYDGVSRKNDSFTSNGDDKVKLGNQKKGKTRKDRKRK